MTTPKQDNDGWTTATSRSTKRDERATATKTLRTDVYTLLTATAGIDNWHAGTNTVVKRLTATVSVGSLRNLPTHVTVNRTDLDEALGGVDGSDIRAAFRAAVQSCRYHLTVEVSDDLSSPDNPRWYSDGGWATDLVDEDLAKAIQNPDTTLNGQLTTAKAQARLAARGV